MLKTLKHRKYMHRRYEESLTIGLPWNGRGHMGVYHVSMSREDKKEWWDLMMSPKVMWTLLNVPRMILGAKFRSWANFPWFFQK
jgi:hypothetical protein